MRKSHLFRILASLLVGLQVATAVADPVVIRADFGKVIGAIKPLNGINRGPIAGGGRVEVIERQKALGLHSIRPHDSHWPNCDVVDIHAVFPNFDADPSKPESYDFALTDEYIEGILKTGAQVIFRLGESIEHTSVKRYVHPPKDYDKWVQICLGIIRHYNEGWAKGFRHNIEYWEIWNEPENRPVMWSGTDEDFLRLYKTAAVKIKKEFPKLKVGGPAFGAYMQVFKEGGFKPVPFTAAFLEMCKKDSVPLDFFSWHCYTDNPAEFSLRGKYVREMLDSYGFQKTESHLNEWNLLPGNTWSEGNTPEEKDEYFAYMAGPAGAAFLTTAIAEMHDSPIDVSNFFHAELGSMGFFSLNGAPYKNYFGMLSFRRLLDLGKRVEVQGATPGRVGVLAATNEAKTECAVLISNYRGDHSEFRIEPGNLPADVTREVFFVNQVHSLQAPLPPVVSKASEPFNLILRAPAVAVVVYRAASEVKK